MPRPSLCKYGDDSIGEKAMLGNGVQEIPHKRLASNGIMEFGEIDINKVDVIHCNA